MSQLSQNTRSTKRQSQALVLGLGKTGLAFTRWLRKHNERARVADTRQNPPGAELLDAEFELICGDFESDLLTGIDRLLVSPGIPANTALLQEARERSMPIYSDIDLFVAENSAPLIAVTGSNGKSTVVRLVEAMLSLAGIVVRAGGNLGTPALELLDGDIPDAFVLELSSFQLERTNSLPARVATILNLSADHLDWHGGMNAYADAKRRILANADCIVMNRGESEIYGDISDRKVISFGLDQPDAGQYGLSSRNDESWLSCGSELLLPVSKMYSQAPHEVLNALAALALVDGFGVRAADVCEALVDFQPLEHRANTVRELAGVRYINDSKATNVGAALASISSVQGPLVLIAGGDAKSADLSPLVGALRGRLRAAVLIGEAAAEIAALLSPIADMHFAGDMSDAVTTASNYAREGDTVLLAPACASTDMFVDFADRGDQFVAAVRGLTK